MIEQLVKRARLQRITNRATDLDDIHGMLEGTWTPTGGHFTPKFAPGTAREKAWARAIKQVTTAVPIIISKTLAGLDLAGITWSDEAGDRGDELLRTLSLPDLARDLVIELRLTGVAAGIASRPSGTDTPTVTSLRGVNVPYVDPITRTVTGWYRALQHVNDAGRLTWWVDVFEFTSDGHAIQRVWRDLDSPTELGRRPDNELPGAARPRYTLNGLQDDGMPSSTVLANMGRILGLYATELRLATVEELASFPMLLTRGDAELDSIGPGEVITVDQDGDAKWLDPGDLSQLREQVTLKRELVREAFALPGGALGNETPSGEALEEANRSFMQETARTGGLVESVLTGVASDYLALHGLPGVTVSLPIDRGWLAKTTLPVLEQGVDLGVVPLTVAARAFQALVGAAYSDEELQTFIDDLQAKRIGTAPGFTGATDAVMPE